MQTQDRLARRQDRLEIVKVLAAYLAASAVMAGAMVGVGNWLHPAGQQTMTFPPGTVITIPPAAK